MYVFLLCHCLCHPDFCFWDPPWRVSAIKARESLGYSEGRLFVRERKTIGEPKSKRCTFLKCFLKKFGGWKREWSSKCCVIYFMEGKLEGGHKKCILYQLRICIIVHRQILSHFAPSSMTSTCILKNRAVNIVTNKLIILNLHNYYFIVRIHCSCAYHIHLYSSLF